MVLSRESCSTSRLPPLITKLKSPYLAFLKVAANSHSELRAELLHLQTTKQTNQLEQVMHAVNTLGLRLGFYQLAELTERVSSARTFMQLSKIAKLQTIVYPFDTFSTADQLISRDELGGTALVSTNHFTRIAGADQRIDPEEWKTIDFEKLNIVDREFAHYDHLSDYLTVDHLQNKSPLGRNILFNQYSGADGKISRDEWREIGFIPPEIHLNSQPFMPPFYGLTTRTASSNTS